MVIRNHFSIKPLQKFKVLANLTLKDAGGDTPAAQEIGYHFSGNALNALKLPDFFKKNVGPRVKESFFA